MITPTPTLAAVISTSGEAPVNSLQPGLINAETVHYVLSVLLNWLGVLSSLFFH